MVPAHPRPDANRLTRRRKNPHVFDIFLSFGSNVTIVIRRLALRVGGLPYIYARPPHQGPQIAAEHGVWHFFEITRFSQIVGKEVVSA